MDLVIHQLNTKLFENQNLSSGDTSAVVEINKFSLYSVQLSWTGLSGTIVIYTEGTNDLDNEPTRVFTAIDTYTLSGSSGSRLINVEKAAYAAFRIRYTSVGGAGTMKCVVNAKVL